MVVTSVTQVENAKIILRMLPIFSCTIIMILPSPASDILNSTGCNDGHQARSVIQDPTGFPPHHPLPILVPSLHRITGNPTEITHLQRIGIGLIPSSVSMAVASAMEVKRKGVVRDHGLLDAIPVKQALPISNIWLSFQYFIFGIADMFKYVGLLEFFYSEAPNSLKSVSTCFLWSSMALGYFFSTILMKIVNQAKQDVARSGGWLAGNNINRNHVNLFYLLLSILSLINFFIYLIFLREVQLQASASPSGLKKLKH